VGDIVDQATGQILPPPADVPPHLQRTVDDVVTLERLREIVQLAPIGIGIVDMHGHTVLTNDALRGMLGYSVDEFAQLTFDRFTHPDDVARNDELFGRMVAGEIDRFEMDKRFIHRDGRIIWGRLQVSLLRDDGHDPAYAIGMVEDVTEERRLRDELERLAFHDALTELPNRRLFRDRVEHQLRRGQREGDHGSGAAMFTDLDDFKIVNDSLGHAAGDQLLRTIASRLVAELRPGDTAGRLGGDEFAILVESVSSRLEAVSIATRLQQAIARPVDLGTRTFTPSVSIGIAMLAECEDTDEVLTTADLAMYRAKELGKGEIVTYSPALLASAMRRLREQQS
jgi:diguanylate cyclase (GGDEF)-like protein/PAS domain S-box-containing protein